MTKKKKCVFSIHLEAFLASGNTEVAPIRPMLSQAMIIHSCKKFFKKYLVALDSKQKQAETEVEEGYSG